MNFKKYIYENEESPLSTVLYHKDIPCITRFFSNDFPVYHAIHKVNDASNLETYTEKHVHDVDEINIIISEDENFKFRIEIDDEEHIVGPHTSVFIPAGKMHSANVICGSGYYIAIRMNDAIKDK
ncbi:cupin domain-containing protein [Anaeromicropila populeti]|uniref:AraC-type arabinose-binding/dimerisation domain-containing protein n=1 Tax=Anaeromicropila populeti TaxID=37658 RepID=A0A1I6L3V1_9FIRM|nr:hypothetical protein [Anaeromicropila populeti]SFR98163.1 hypothetical protein SAMN05661086_03041 [Anaeromicropila populeti]